MVWKEIDKRVQAVLEVTPRVVRKYCCDFFDWDMSAIPCVYGPGGSLGPSAVYVYAVSGWQLKVKRPGVL